MTNNAIPLTLASILTTKYNIAVIAQNAFAACAGGGTAAIAPHAQAYYITSAAPGFSCTVHYTGAT